MTTNRHINWSGESVRIPDLLTDLAHRGIMVRISNMNISDIMSFRYTPSFTVAFFVEGRFVVGVQDEPDLNQALIKGVECLLNNGFEKILVDL